MRRLFATILALGWWTAGVALAQQPATPTSPFAPIETPTVNPEMFKTPQTPPSADAPKIKPDKSADAAPAIAIPNGIDLGKSKLQFDAKHTSAVTAPGVSTDSGETSNLSKVMPGETQDKVLPDYFGFKLITPVR